jgi:hypothetical protein
MLIHHKKKSESPSCCSSKALEKPAKTDAPANL